MNYGKNVVYFRGLSPGCLVPVPVPLAVDSRLLAGGRSVTLTGNQAVVWSDAVPDPVVIRYAWADNPVNPNLYNKESLSASPFTTAP